MKTTLLPVLFFLWIAANTYSQPSRFIYNESEVPVYHLPDPLLMQSGMKVSSIEQWEEEQRPQLLQLFETYVYGVRPDQNVKVELSETKRKSNFLNGKATLKEVEMYLEGAKQTIAFLIITPNNTEKKVPVFAGLNFNGNHTLHSSTEISMATVWNRSDGVASLADEETRGSAATRWPVERIIDRGYAIITAYYGDIDPDFDDGFKNGIHAHFHEERDAASWGSISAWAWGLSRMLDYANVDPALDENRVVVLGHSRLGKTALWAGATDERFAAVIANNSGCGGAALSRRNFGETIESITRVFPHWFCARLTEYGSDLNELPVDQHELLALLAPRPVYIASAEQDQWADPHGEFLSLVAAEPVYKLYGFVGLPVDRMPAVNRPVNGQNAYHIRTGKHDITPYDWELFLDFADRHVMEK